MSIITGHIFLSETQFLYLGNGKIGLHFSSKESVTAPVFCSSAALVQTSSPTNVLAQVSVLWCLVVTDYETVLPG